MNEHSLALDLLLICISCGAAGVLAASNSSISAPPFTSLTSACAGCHADPGSVPRTRRRRFISQDDRLAILDYHNKVRGNVLPPASNMEYMVWDEALARRAEEWASMCLWEHGPRNLLRFLGQNLSVRTGRYRSILQLVKPWYDEVKDYSFPYPRDCKPRCPLKCYGPMCTHYTQGISQWNWPHCDPDQDKGTFFCGVSGLATCQGVFVQTHHNPDQDKVTMVWATSNKVGCAVHTCHNMNVWGSVWRRATYLVCNYSSKGNWIGEAPYKVGVPCSMCPPSYGGSCSNNMCFPAVQSNHLHWLK